MTFKEAVALLRSGGVEDAEYDAREIFSSIDNVAKAELLFSDPIASEDAQRAILRRVEREPLQYILGRAYFYRECYKVNEGCLIPRQDTEVLVDYAVRHIPAGGRILDLCTGSGCVGISTLKNTCETCGILVDISADALDIARENAQLCGVLHRAELIQMDILDRLPEGRFCAILSNPPYVTDEEYKNLPCELYKEPEIAFVGGADGCDFYRSLIPRLKEHLEPDGFVAFEIGYMQGDALRNIGSDFGYSVEIIRDMSNKDRVAVLRLK